MTYKNFFKTLSSKILLALALISCVLSLVFCVVACGEDSNPNSTYKEPTVSFTEEDDGEISNPTFSYGLKNLSTVNYPITSTTGWSKTTDNLAISSNINSGIVNVNDWDKVIEELNKDTDFSDYLKKYDKDKDTATDLFENPGKPSSAKDGYVYMLNNYRSKKFLGFGTAQKVTSSKTVNIKKDTIGKISLWIKTDNILGANNYGKGANIRLTNSYNSTAQANFEIRNIIANDWTQYTIYVKGDSTYNTSFTLVVGLGYGNGAAENEQYYSEGTVYFDEVVYEEVDSIPTVDDQKTMVYASKNALTVDDNSTYQNKSFLYDMSIPVVNSKFNDVNDPDYYFFTKSNTGATGNVSSESTANATFTDSTKSAIKVDINKASYTIKLDNEGAFFSLDAGKFTVISFDVLNELSKFGNSIVSIDVFEKLGNDGEEVKRASVATFTTPSDTATRCNLFVKNNFTQGTRLFYVNIIVGPVNVATTTNVHEYATGSVTLSNLSIVSGDILQSGDEGYELYSLQTTSPTATVALYSGYASDYVKPADTTYNFEVAPGNVGTIVAGPSAVKGYSGITPDHAYIKGDSTNTAVNDRVDGDANGSYAGVINTKYTYSQLGDLSALGNEDKQFLMIYNKVADRYGFIGESNSVTGSDFAKVTVRLKVVGDDAKAFIYLVDTKKIEKEVITFSNFNNVDGSNLKFMLKVDQSMMDADGFATVNFYLGTGKTARDFRVEVWNGERDANGVSSIGYVFVESITVTTTAGFSEPTRKDDTFSVAGNPLFDEGLGEFNKEGCNLYEYTRKLTATEKEFNEEYPLKKVKYSSTYVWANSQKMVYGIFNTIDPVDNDPYATIDEEEDGGCVGQTDPSSFWLGFSSIILGVVLVAAIVVLFTKKIIERRKANRNDAKAHYNVSSRASVLKQIKKKKTEKVEEIVEDEQSVVDEVEQESPATEIKEETLDEYVYGEVVENFDDLQREPTNATEQNEETTPTEVIDTETSSEESSSEENN